MENNIDNYKTRFFNLLESTMGDVKPLLVEQINTKFDKKYDYKKEGNNFFYKLKTSKDWVQAKGSGLEAIKTKVFNVTPSTQNKVQTTKQIDTNKVTSGKDNYDCIAVSKDTCKKILPTTQVEIGKGDAKEGCAAYAIKCLSQYDNDLNLGGAAWFALPKLKSKGVEKYNMFTNEINWDKIREDAVKQKITKTLCDKHIPEGLDRDKNEPSVKNFIIPHYPESSKINLNNLKLGDFVGLYWKDSTNVGKAFCQRAIEKGLDDKGQFSKKEPFSFNTHIGFVGAIKNGEPIIFHNVHGTYLATPAKQYLTKSGKGMITWVVSDPEITTNIQNPKSDEEGPLSWVTKFFD